MKLFHRVLSFVLMVATIIPYVVFPFTTYAASLTTLSDTMSSATISAVSNHDISFVTPTGVAAGATITLTFQSDFSIPVGLTFADVDVLDNGSNVTLAAAPVTTTWGVLRTSSTLLTITNGSSAVTAGHTIRIKIGTNATNQSTGTFQITNATTTGTKTVTIGGTFGDTGTVSVQLVTNDTVAVSATVPQSLTFSLSATSLALGTLSTGSASTGTITFNVATNGTSGLNVAASGTTLTSGSNTIAACSSGCTSNPGGAEQFGFNLVSNSSPSVGAAASGSAPIATAATNYNTANTFRFAPAGETVATAANPVNTTTFTVAYIANIKSTTPAGSYAGTTEFIETANF
jgi:hypothetical protein